MSAAEKPLPPTTGWVAEHEARYAASDGADGHLWRGVPTLLLTTRGRRSGQPAAHPAHLRPRRRLLRGRGLEGRQPEAPRLVPQPLGRTPT